MINVEQPKISVIIPVYNGGDNFRHCLDSLTRSVRQPDEIIVVADGDTDGSGQVAEAFGARVFRYPSAGGPARARNRGGQEAAGDILFFIDADVTLHPDTIARVEETFQRYPNLSALVGSYDDEPGASNFLSQYKNLFHHYTHQVSSHKASTFWGACGAIRRSVFQAVGGFDEGYEKPCIEDIELGYRLKQAGYAIRLCKDIQVKHLKRWEPVSLLKAEIFYRALPWTELLLSNRQFNTDLNLGYTTRLSIILVFALMGTVFAILGSLPLAGINPSLLMLAFVLMLALLVVNWNVYQFFIEKRGFFFTLKVVPWHWLYFFYAGASFAYGLVRYYFNRWRLPKLPLPVKVYKSQ
jgi:glycosyltransferase involved in cell wall biosynthesis